MTVKIVISAAVVSAIITLIGNIIAAKIAQKTAVKTAQETANQEIKKMERAWEREDIVSSDEEFADMACAVAKYIHRDTVPHAIDAVGLVASVRSKEHGELGRILDSLHKSLHERDIVSADRELTNAISEKRRLKEKAQSSSYTEINAR